MSRSQYKMLTSSGNLDRGTPSNLISLDKRNALQLDVDIK